MKKTIITFLLGLICLAAGATQQVNDKVNVNGEVWEMPASPLGYLHPQLQEAFTGLLGERNFINTSIYRGYIAYWYVKRGRLYLEKVEVPQESGEFRTIDGKELKKVFRRYSCCGKIKAGWMTGKVTIGKGIGERNPERPFAPEFAEEKTLVLKKGRITD